MLTRRALPLLALAASSKLARADTVDLALTCDTTLASALRKVAAGYMARTGVQIFVFPTAPQLILPQLVRNIQNDIVVTQTAILDQAAKVGMIAMSPAAQWRNPLVIAGLQGAATLDRTFAVIDQDVPATLDIRPSHIVGAIDGDGVAFLITTGVAQAGLLHMTDVRAHEGLAVVRAVPVAPLQYAASVTKLSQRPNPEGFISFLTTPEATAMLTAAGLETQT